MRYIYNTFTSFQYSGSNIAEICATRLLHARILSYLNEVDIFPAIQKKKKNNVVDRSRLVAHHATQEKGELKTPLSIVHYHDDSRWSVL